MASLQIDPSGNYHVKFRFAGKQYRRSLRTKMRRTAEASACRMEENIRLIEGGCLELPEEDICRVLDLSAEGWQSLENLMTQAREKTNADHKIHFSAMHLGNTGISVITVPTETEGFATAPLYSYVERCMNRADSATWVGLAFTQTGHRLLLSSCFLARPSRQSLYRFTFESRITPSFKLASPSHDLHRIRYSDDQVMPWPLAIGDIGGLNNKKRIENPRFPDGESWLILRASSED